MTKNNKDMCPYSRLFGENVSRLRKRQKLTQEELADQTGIDLRYIQRAEAGKIKKADVDILVRLRPVLQCTWRQLFYGFQREAKKGRK